MEVNPIGKKSAADKTREARLREFGFEPKAFDELVKRDPTYEILAASYWQNPSNFASAMTTVKEYTDLFPLSNVNDGLPSDASWRDLQKAVEVASNTFGPLRAAIETKADMVAGKGFGYFSYILEVNEFLRDIFTHPRNNYLITWLSGIMKFMLSVGEVFILISFDEFGNESCRLLDHKRIGEGKDDTGLVTDPLDVSATMFYKYVGSKTTEYIPDVRYIYETEEQIKIREKNLQTAGLLDAIKQALNKEQTVSAKHKAIGGYRRFILHWKNLTGINEILRDTSPTVTTLEWINLYINAMKWELDYKKALCSFVIVMGFTETPDGRIASAKWMKMTDDEKAATNLTRPLTPGSRVWLIPGMSLKIEAPQLPKLSGDNADLINVAGAGAKTPMDLWQGQSSGMPYASIKATRAPLTMEVENLQNKMHMFLRYRFIPVIGIAKIKLTGGKFSSVGAIADPKGQGKGTEYTLLPSYPTPWIAEMVDGEPTGQSDIQVEFWHEDIMKFDWPIIELSEDSEKEANALMGSKHSGALGLDVSQETIARRLKLGNIDREKRKRAIERIKYGDPQTGIETEQQVEESPIDKEKKEKEEKKKADSSAKERAEQLAVFAGAIEKGKTEQLALFNSILQTQKDQFAVLSKMQDRPNNIKVESTPMTLNLEIKHQDKKPVKKTVTFNKNADGEMLNAEVTEVDE